jgi:flagellar hook assembly protein FlgD
MATYHGNSGAVHIATSTVVLVLKSFQHTNSVESADDSAAGDAVRSRKAGKKDGQGQIEVWWDPTDTNGQQALDEGVTVNLILYPSGTTTGCGKLSGSVLVKSVAVQHDQDDIVSATFTYEGYLTPALVTP